MKVFLFAAIILAAPFAIARPTTTCRLASGSDSLYSFQFVDDGGAYVSINGIHMRDLSPDSAYGFFHSPSLPDYYFSPRPSSPGPSIDVLKTSGARLIYHCDPLL
jgi:hypothetical protein